MEFRITITKRNDFMTLETAVHRLLGCQSSSCTFFQTAAYIDLKLSVCAFVLSAAAQPPPLVLSIPPFLLSLLDDGCTILVKPPENDKKAAAPKKKEQGFIDSLSLRASHT